MSVTTILVILIVAISFYAGQNPELKYKLMMSPYQINQKKEYYRFLTSGFIHADIMHLLFNMVALYSFGKNVEWLFQMTLQSQLMGQLAFLLLFLAGVVLSSLPSYYKHKDDYAYNALGASGGVSSIVFARILYNPLSEINIHFVFPIPGFILGILYLIYSHYADKRGTDNIGHSAHFYGAIFGLVFAIVLEPSAVPHFFQQVANWSFF